MIEIRANKKTRNADDYKVLLVGVVCTIIMLITSLIIPRLNEQRWYRDFVRLTPFYDVQLVYSNVSDDTLSIVIGGSLVKRRCEYNNLFGYIYAANGIRYRVPVDISKEPIQGNRPPSEEAESWGPWTISVDDNPNFPVTTIPVKWEVIAEHIACPTEPVTQRNLFIGGNWEDFLLVPENDVEGIQDLIKEEKT